MIRLLLIALVFLFILWLIIELFSKNSGKKLKFRIKPSYLMLIILIFTIPIILKFFPKTIASLGSIKNILAPFIGIIKSFLPFI